MYRSLLAFAALFLYISFCSAQIRITDPGAQPQEEYKKDVELEDIDSDGVPDSLYYDFARQSIVIKLSTKSFQRLDLSYPLDEINSMLSVKALEGGFTLYHSHMRSFTTETYQYEKETVRFRLKDYWHENFGNAANDGSGTYSVNLITGDFLANWNFYDMEQDSLISLPELNFKLHDAPYSVYWGESFPEGIPAYDLFDSYKAEYTPAFTDTVKYVATNRDYDLEVLVTEKDGEPYEAAPVSVVLENVFKGDLIVVLWGTDVYYEYGDGSYRAQKMITNIEKIASGKLSLFYQKNKKPITYRGVHTGYWRYENRCPLDVDYFLANTGNKKVRQFLKKEGTLDVEFSEFEKDDDFTDSCDDCLLATISNKHKNMTEDVCKLVVKMTGDFTEYYIFDEKNSKFHVVDTKDW